MENEYRTDLWLDPVAKNISKATARGLEQALIMQCRTLNRDHLYPRNNQINGLAPNHKFHAFYWDAGNSWLDENLVSCN